MIIDYNITYYIIILDLQYLSIITLEEPMVEAAAVVVVVAAVAIVD
jgi:hypothetical protein